MKKIFWSLHQVRGFTLIELMVALTVLAIMTMLATPSLASALENQKLKQVAVELKTALQEARSQAILTRSEQVVCASQAATQSSCGLALANYSALSDIQKKQQITLIPIPEKIQVARDSATQVLFSTQGYSTEQIITLCTSQRAYSITVYVSGQVELVQDGVCT